MRVLTTASAAAAALLFAAPGWAEETADTATRAEPADGGQGLGTQTRQTNGDAQTSAGAAFNPAISVILDTVYSQVFSGEAEDPPGFGGGHDDDHGHEEGHGHSHGIEDGFQIREVEVVLSGSVDPYFDLVAQLGFSEDGVELEEGYFQTTSLPGGLQIKGGKFLSDVGYINRQHTHNWDFTDQPLVMESLFGDEGLNEVGLQLSWLPATRMYSRFGVELLEGDNEVIANASEEADEFGLEEASSPRLITAFAKFGPDLGHDHALLGGISGGYSEVWQEVDEEHDEALDGDAWFVGLDFVYKYDAGRTLGHGNWTVQGEYFYRERDVDFREDGVREGSGKFKQDGLYLQTVYGFRPRWNTGLRFDAVGLSNDAFDHEDEAFTDFGTTYRYSAQVSYLPTEFSRLRFQLGQTDLSDGAHHDDHGGHHDDPWRADLQFTYALGAHGAHAF